MFAIFAHTEFDQFMWTLSNLISSKHRERRFWPPLSQSIHTLVVRWGDGDQSRGSEGNREWHKNKARLERVGEEMRALSV